MIPVVPLALAVLAPVPDDGVKAWAGKLSSDRPSEWRVAQAYLARAAAVTELEKLADGAGDPMKQRLKETVSLMLRNVGGAEALRKQPKLWAVCEAEAKAAADAVKVLAGSERYETGIGGRGAPPKLTPARKAVNDLVGARGFAVLAAPDLLADPKPGSRMYGIEVLHRLNAVGPHAAVAALVKDDTPIVLYQGDYSIKSTIGKEAEKWQRANDLRAEAVAGRKPAAWSEAENYLDWLEAFAAGRHDNFKLLNRVRQEAKATEADSWDDFWRRARPVLEKAWDGK